MTPEDNYRISQHEAEIAQDHIIDRTEKQIEKLRYHRGGSRRLEAFRMMDLMKELIELMDGEKKEW